MTVDDVEVVAIGQRPPGGEHVVVHALDPGHELLEVAGRRRLGHAMHAHAGADLLGQVGWVGADSACEDVDGDVLLDEPLGKLAHVSRQAALDDRRVLPGQDEDAPRHEGVRSLPAARQRGCRPDDASVSLLGPEAGQDRAS